MNQKQFTICEGKGFQLKFSNGWTVSVQWGPMNYCENRSSNFDFPSRGPKESIGCDSAEIAAWDSNDNWYQFDHDTVKGWCTADEVADFISLIKNM